MQLRCLRLSSFRHCLRGKLRKKNLENSEARKEESPLKPSQVFVSRGNDEITSNEAILGMITPEIRGNTGEYRGIQGNTGKYGEIRVFIGRIIGECFYE